MVTNPRTQQFLLIVSMILLIACEVFLLSLLLPAQWRHEIYYTISASYRQSYDQSLLTHPEVGWEANQVIREHLWLRVLAYGFIVMIMVGNLALLYMIGSAWRALKQVDAREQRSL